MLWPRLPLASVATGLLALLLSAGASALTITPTFINTGGENWNAERKGVVTAAAAQWEASILGTDALGVYVAFRDFGIGGPLGTTNSSFVSYLGDDIFPTSQVGCSSGLFVGSPCATHVIEFNISSLDSLFFDLTPETSDDIPFSAYDAYSVALHELGHALGFASGTWKTDFLTESESELWDRHIVGTIFDPDGLAVALASEDDLSHLPGGAGDLMSTSLVNGTRLEISATDLEMLSLAYGYATVPEPPTTLLLLIGLAIIRRRAHS